MFIIDAIKKGREDYFPALSWYYRKGSLDGINTYFYKLCAITDQRPEILVNDQRISIGINDGTVKQIERIDIRVWEKNAYVSSTGSQEIRTAIYDEGTPLENFEPLLIATMPDGSQRKAYFPPSDEDGCSAIKLAPINAPNGTLIAYRVCLFGMDEQ